MGRLVIRNTNLFFDQITSYLYILAGYRMLASYRHGRYLRQLSSELWDPSELSAFVFCLSSQGSGCEYIEYCHWNDSLIDWVDSRGLSQYRALTLLVFRLRQWACFSEYEKYQYHTTSLSSLSSMDAKRSRADRADKKNAQLESNHIWISGSFPKSGPAPS